MVRGSQAWMMVGLALAGGLVGSPVEAQAAPASEVQAQVAEQTLFAPGMALGEGRLELRFAEAQVTERGTLRIRLKPGTEWPEVCLRAPDGKWDVSRFGYLNMRVSNVGPAAAGMGWRIDNKGADGSRNCLQVFGNVVPGQSYEYIVPIVRGTSDGLKVKMFGMRGYPPEIGGGMGGGRSIDPSRVLCVRMFGHNLTEPIEMEIERIWASGTPGKQAEFRQVDPDRFFPCIDTFGQFIHREWPGKVHSLAELRGRVAEEERDLAAHPGPQGWNRWGGWADGPQLKATGFFRVEKFQGKWWLVDPDGRLFFSHGPDCVGEKNYTPIDEREHWFQDFPGRDSAYKAFWGKQWHVVNGHYQGKQPRTFDISSANLMRKYGDGWFEKYVDRTHRRLRSWGMNTIANWSDPAIYLTRRTPYFVCLGTPCRPLEGSTGYWGKFKDVFDPSFAQGIREQLRAQVGKSVNDPWCIGYFVDNELSWGDETSLAVGALRSPADQRAKQEFLRDLQAKYGDVAALNRAWGTAHASWQALLESREAPPEPERAKADLLAFNARMAAVYFRTIRDAIREAAPNQLYAGCRFAWVNGQVAKVAAQFCDIVSYNLYRTDVSAFRCLSGADVPTIIGEFHFGALDRGMFHTGLVSTPSQEARAQAYRSYVAGVLRNPQFVGCHWFKYMDEPCTGRALDGENYQIGFLDIADTPYQETVDQCRDIGYRLYDYRLNAR